jgi:anti-anti-sigma factor
MSSIICDIRDQITIVSFTVKDLSQDAVISDVRNKLIALASRKDVRRLLLNFRGVAFIASEMLGQLAGLKKKCDASNVSLKICGVSEGVHRVLKLIRLDAFFDIFIAEHEALEAFKKEIRLGAALPAFRPEETWGHADLHREAADAGRAESQYRLGRCYENGLGVEQSFEAAAHWFGRAAAQNHMEAQYALAHCFAYGMGVAKDYRESLRLYREAAERGHVEAAYFLGMSYDFGIGVPSDREEALQWYKEAARAGDERAREAVAYLESV